MDDTLKRLGKNVGGYFGETIDIAAVLNDCSAAAGAHGWHIDKLAAAPNLDLLAFTRIALRATRKTRHMRRLYISAGIHGDEPAGPLAVRQLLSDNAWPANIDVWLCPCLNPGGFRLNRRE